MATTLATPQTKFIWLIAAVRRDCPTIKAVIHHIAANSEREARRTLARDHVTFFAGRVPVQEVRHV
ncbi:TPA: host cell division inhibitor Icd-like protein [Citrobacter freundii]|nr:host cell division inhibitor Icd-like protein [Citrobacter freundii]HCC6820895.1 host cell division inhibitor Icd-like protein [Citrobacter freundii]